MSVVREDVRHAESACPLDCPDACSLDVSIAGDRVVAVGGSRKNPVTEGYICAKVRRYPEHMYGPTRMLHPGIRTGRKGQGEFRRASWDEALDLVATKMKAVRDIRGGEGIVQVSYGGSNGYLSQDTTDARLFYRLGASRLLRTVCAAPSGSAAMGLYGKMPGVAYQDYAHANLVVVWGMNASVTGIHLVPYILEARKRGAKLVVVDPRRTRLADGADLHLALRPGTDLPVALAVIRWLFESGRADRKFLAETAHGADELERRAWPWTIERASAEAGIAASDLEAFARLYAETSPAALRCGWGPERNRNGGSAIAAILALPAVAGKFGVRGGGYTLSNSGAWKEIDGIAAVAAPEPSTRAINMNRLGAALAERGAGSVDLLFVYNSNPLMTLPEQERVRAGLEREDLFTVVFDPVMTDTARYADVVLPAATFLERTELSRGYGAFVLQKAVAAVPPAGEARPNHEVFAELCRRTGVARADDPESAEDIASVLLRTSRRGEALAKDLSRDGVAFLAEGVAPVQFVDAFPRTPDGKIYLVPEDLDREAPEGLYRYRADVTTARFPLALISPSSDRTISSTLGDLHRAAVPLAMHPGDAAARSVKDGDRVRVFNELGSVRCRARLDSGMREGVVFLPKGLWSHNTDSGTTANALSPDTLTDIGGGACFNDARVEVERLGEA
ncbi:MAG TPA: molybdopterin-dependent oxidoreductase [Thermoanaerobaculia bacterium]|nr:molybdopterin-dependent oxidoreductase [Thermoanaerobaculia bacterium]